MFNFGLSWGTMTLAILEHLSTFLFMLWDNFIKTFEDNSQNFLIYSFEAIFKNDINLRSLATESFFPAADFIEPETGGLLE